MAQLEITVEVSDDNILGKIAKVEEARRAFNVADWSATAENGDSYNAEGIDLWIWKNKQ